MGTLQLNVPLELLRVDLAGLLTGSSVSAIAGGFRYVNGNERVDLIGTGLVADINGALTSGIITSVVYFDSGVQQYSATGLSTLATVFSTRIQNNNNIEALSVLLAGNDTINGSSGQDQLSGFAGNDTINLGSNNGNYDEAIGFTGNDNFNFTPNGTPGGFGVYYWLLNDLNSATTGSALTSGITANINLTDANVEAVSKGLNGTDTINGINLIDTNDGGFDLGGTRLQDVYNINTGSSDLYFSIEAGSGNDTFNLNGNGFYALRYEFGLPDGTGIFVNLSSVAVAGVAAKTVRVGTSEVDTITGNGLVRQIQGSQSADRMVGGTAGEQFDPRGGNDTIDGGQGYDTIRFQDSRYDTGVTVNLLTGVATGTYDNDGDASTSNSVAYTLSISNIEEVQGSRQNDRLTGNASTGFMEGNDGDDSLDSRANGNEASLNGGRGNDTLLGGDYNEGGQGNDIIDTASTTGDGFEAVAYMDEGGGSGIRANLTGAAITILGSSVAAGRIRDTFGTTDTVSNFEELIGTRSADVIFTRNLSANPQNDWFSVVGGDGADQFFGSSGKDELRYEKEHRWGGNQGVIVNLSGGVQEGLAGGTAKDAFGKIDTLSSIEIAHGTRYVDKLFGGTGNETLFGHDGADILSGGGGFDIAAYNSDHESDDVGLDNQLATQGVRVNLSGSALTLGGISIAAGSGRDGWGNTDSLGSIEEIWGSKFDDFMNAGSGNANLWGGSDGNDVLTGGVGANKLWGDNGNDLLDALGADDQLEGGIGSDTLLGGQGNDTLNGGAGKDLFTGGGGLDRFIFSALGDSGTTFATRDVINTFAHGDKIDLSAIDARTNLANDQAFSFIGAAAFSGAAGQLRFDMNNISSTGVKAYLVQGDVNGDRVADFTLQIFTSPTADRTGQPQTWNLFAWDFIL